MSSSKSIIIKLRIIRFFLEKIAVEPSTRRFITTAKLISEPTCALKNCCSEAAMY
jgi:hypothetical protein